MTSIQLTHEFLSGLNPASVIAYRRCALSASFLAFKSSFICVRKPESFQINANVSSLYQKSHAATRQRSTRLLKVPGNIADIDLKHRPSSTATSAISRGNIGDVQTYMGERSENHSPIRPIDSICHPESRYGTVPHSFAYSFRLSPQIV